MVPRTWVIEVFGARWSESRPGWEGGTGRRSDRFIASKHAILALLFVHRREGGSTREDSHLDVLLEVVVSIGLRDELQGVVAELGFR